MDVETAIRTRRSVRGFTRETVPPETMRRIFETAQLAPSNCNVQPWRVYVASGPARDRIRSALIEQAKLGTPSNSDFEYTDRFEEPYRKHQIECAVALYNAAGQLLQQANGRAIHTLSLAQWPRGMYYLKVSTTGGQQAVRSIVVTH
ncbi:MAG: T9SS C-terminal target domain-containing protein [Chitinophagia bacterium]|nr:T9SS C-terminal target domain-containing protein [Chitinophagia bacterium]